MGHPVFREQPCRGSGTDFEESFIKFLPISDLIIIISSDNNSFCSRTLNGTGRGSDQLESGLFSRARPPFSPLVRPVLCVVVRRSDLVSAHARLLVSAGLANHF